MRYRATFACGADCIQLTIQERAKYHYWLFGHYHDNKAIDKKHILLWEQIMRGQLYEISGKRIFTMGGASSHDIQDGILEPDDPNFERKLRQLNAAGALFRVDHHSWWKEELPDDAEYQTARETLDKAGWNVDYIITHCCPSSIQDIFSGGLYRRDALTDFFDEIRERCRFKYWFFGHYHENMVVAKEFVMLYKQIIRLK